MIPDADLESRMKDVWHRFMSAAVTGDASASAIWREWQQLRAQRTAEQTARALVIAGLNPDGTPVAPKAYRVPPPPPAPPPVRIVREGVTSTEPRK